MKSEREEMLRDLNEIMEDIDTVGLVRLKLEVKGTKKGLATSFESGYTDDFDMIIEASDYEVEKVKEEVENAVMEKINTMQEDLVKIIMDVTDTVDEEKFEKLLDEKRKKDKKEDEERRKEFIKNLSDLVSLGDI